MKVHHIFANRSNIGDWLSARGIRELLEGGGAEVREYLCDGPFVEETLTALRSAEDLMVIGGGGLLMDYFMPFWAGFHQWRPKPAYALWGLGFCDVKGEGTLPSLGLLREVVEESAVCHVRDALSRGYLAGEASLPPAGGCPAVCVIAREDCGERGILHVDNYTTAGAEVFSRMDEMARAYAHETGRPYRRTNNRIGAGRESELQKTLELYRRSDLIVSSALHGAIIGVAMGRRVVVVSGDWKMESFMEAIGLRDWVLDVSEVERLPELMRAAESQPDVASRIDEMREGQRAIAAEVLAIGRANRR